MKNQSRMMIGIGMPMSQRMSERMKPPCSAAIA